MTGTLLFPAAMRLEPPAAIITPKVWGSERLIHNAGGYCGKVMRLDKGWRCSLHCHRVKDEVLHLHSGLVVFEINNQEFMFTQGHSIHVRPGEYHRFSGLEDSVLFECSTHDDPADCHRLEPSGPMP